MLFDMKHGWYGIVHEEMSGVLQHQIFSACNEGYRKYGMRNSCIYVFNSRTLHSYKYSWGKENVMKIIGLLTIVDTRMDMSLILARFSYFVLR